MADNALIQYDTIVDPTTGQTIRVPSITVHPANAAVTTTPAGNTQAAVPQASASPTPSPTTPPAANTNALVRLAQPNEVNDPVTGQLRTIDFNSEFAPLPFSTSTTSNALLQQALENKASAARIGGKTVQGPDGQTIKADGATILDYLHTMLRMPQTAAEGLVQSVVSGATLPGDVASGKTQVRTAEGDINPDVIERSLDLTGLMASGTLGGVPEGSLGSGAVKPAIKPSVSPTVVQPFYSSLDRAVDSVPLTKAPAEQWLGTLQNTPGVKGEEFDWRGLGSWLEGQKGQQVTKQQVQDYLQQNPVNVQEVQKFGSELDSQDAVYARAEQLAQQAGDPGNPERFIEIADEELRGGPQGGGLLAKYSDYQLPGGDNYREVLLALPTNKTGWAGDYAALDAAARNKYGVGYWDKLTPEEKTVFQAASNKNIDFQSSHWDEPNVLAHVRLNDRQILTGEAPTPAVEGFSVYNRASGNKSPVFETRAEAQAYYDKLPVLIQKSAYIIGDSTPQGTTPAAKTLFMEEAQSDWHQKGRKEGYQNQGYKVYNKNDEPIAGPFKTQEEAADYARGTGDPFATWDNKSTTTGVPDAPFKKTWPDLILRRLVREAAEKGYDQIAWTDGATQADRYDLGKKIDALDWSRDREGRGNYRLAFWKDGRNIEAASGITPEKLADYVGKDLADKIANAPGKEQPPFEGQLREGGSLRKLDLRVGGEGMKAFYDQELPRRANKLFGKLGGKVETKKLLEQGYGKSDENMLASAPMTHILKITPQMREAALRQGFPLFSTGVPLPTDQQPTVNREYDVPAFAGSSNDASTVYIDRHVPRSINIGGKDVDIAPFLATHETTEHKLMVEDGLPYADAHKQATAAERAQVEAAGIDWKSYEAHINGMLRTVEQEKLAQTPPDLYLKPYHSADWGAEEQDIMRHADKRNTHKLVPVTFDPFAKRAR